MLSIFDFLFSSAATLALFGVVAVAQPQSAQPTFAVPALTGPVVDNAGMLSESARERLSRFLRDLNDDGTQLQILTVDNLGGLSIEEASIKVTDQWKLGTAKGDNGILLMLSRQERRVRIEVGQGYEGDLPDITASRIVREVILPQFREGDFDRGVIDGVLAIVHYVNPKFLDSHNAPRKTKSSGVGFWLIIGWLLVFFVIPRFFGFRWGNSRNRWRGGWNDWGGGGWGSGGWGGGSGGFGGGGGWGGGSSGGGWSGGGGGFSGGGASGGW